MYSWVDNTTAGIWKRAQMGQSAATFTKMRLSKVILLADSKTRKEYFTQQGGFVTDKSRLDSHVEFSTSILIPSFKPKLLAVRSSKSLIDRIFTIQMFWVFTLLGLSVPFRVWFAHRCDELHIMVVKETCSSNDRPSFKKNVFGAESFFHSRMQEAQLYH